MASFSGTSGNDVVDGTSGVDDFDFSQGGNDILDGMGNNDVFHLGAAFGAQDQINGGAGVDNLELDGDYSAGLTFNSSTLVNVENIVLRPLHRYTLTPHDSTTAAGQTLAFLGFLLGADDVLIVHGEAETDGRFNIAGGNADDQLYGGANADIFNIGAGGVDIAKGFGGDDLFRAGPEFSSADQLDGGAGNDALELNGDYGRGVTFTATTLVGVESIILISGNNYRLTTHDATVAAGQLLFVDGSGLLTGTLRFDGSAEVDGELTVLGGAGADTLIGGAFFDNLNGGGGDDVLEAGASNDTVYGGSGSDTASFAHASGGVTVDLAVTAAFQTIGGGQGSDFLNSIENAVGSAFDDTLRGDGVANVLSGGAGNDLLRGDLGNDALDGGAGDDTAAFLTARGSSIIQDFGARIVVTGPDGTDTLTGVEHLKFTDVTLTPVDDGNPLFDALYYLSLNPDVAAAGVDAFWHFQTTGWMEGRDPNGYFDTSFYRAVNPGIGTANPLDHYHATGWKLGYDPSPGFDTRLYLLNNPDVAAAGIDPLAHFLQSGFSEGRQAYAAIGTAVNGFDAQHYILHNPDVAAAGVDPLWHFQVTGWREGRDPNAYFDTAGYLGQNGDVAAAGIDPLWHYIQHGWKEGRDPSATFDTLGYLSMNGDVAAAGVNPLDHYLNFGVYEGRAVVNDGVWH
jgi:Ca2+-binding RTX toxin-like protein